MASFVPRFIVQDRESKLFLMPSEGDVGFTPWLVEAGRFGAMDEAVDTAHANCSEGFDVVKVCD